MSNRTKISQLPEAAALAAGDLVPVVDVSTGQTKRATRAQVVGVTEAVGRTDAQTLTNKTIDAGANTITGLGLPVGAVVGTTDTQTLTNKTIDASANTLLNLPNPPSTAIRTAAADPVDPAVGDVYFNTVDGVAYIWTGTEWLSGGSGALPFDGLLDTYTGAHAAYSFRRLTGAYTGPLALIERESDRATFALGYDEAGEPDTAGLTTFLNELNPGTETGRLVVWFDQTGNGRNLTRGHFSANETAPRVWANTLLTLNGKMRANIASGNWFLSGGAGIWSQGAMTDGFSAFFVMQATAGTTGTNQGILTINEQAAAGFRWQLYSQASGNVWRSRHYAGATTPYIERNAPISAGHRALGSTYTGGSAATDIRIWLDGTAIDTASGSAGTYDPAAVTFSYDSVAVGMDRARATGSNAHLMDFQELIIFTSGQAASAAALQTAQKAYWID